MLRFFKMLRFLSLAVLALTIMTLIIIPNQTAFHEEDESNFKGIILAQHNSNHSKLTLKDNLPDVGTIAIHPYSADYLMTGFAIPHESITRVSNFSQTGIVSGTSSGGKSKRVPYLWLTFVMIKLGFTGISLMGTYYSCQNWSQGGAQWYDKAGCVVGAVSSTVVIGTTSLQGVVNHAGITEANHPWLTNINQAWNGKKRSITPDSYMGNLTELTVAFANVTGLSTATLIKNNMDIALNDQTGYPIHIVLTPGGQLLHISVMHIDQKSWTFRAADPSIFNTTLTKKSKDFNMENFSHGGIEASMDYEKPEHAQLSPQYDWTQITDQVSCYLGDMSGNAYQYQVFDNNHGETEGTIRAFSDEPFDQFTIDLSYLSWPVCAPRPECKVS
ncbi:hypothetical protein HG537_0C06270 [Torulaspora globosa]|uniref:Uncharacterized protein n=1 Tax=Torulaspora globosa TaxID=48254 RepID=A0A7H9HQG2_9SACH|nr:hypothetical protein HG537_0C06270 [Torulaspora sp. CBS 2947]